MKTRFKIFGLFLIGLMMIGLACNRDSLEIPPSSLTEADYFKTESEFERAVLGVYARVTDLYNFNAGTILQPLYFFAG